MVLVDAGLVVMEPRVCQRCGKEYKPTARCQKYCGKQKIKGTCSRLASDEKRIAWLAKNPPDRTKYRGRYKHLYQKKRARLYGLTLDQMKELFAQHGGLCAICGNAPGAKGLHVDHDHVTGKVRGALCMTCNTRLGALESPWFAKATTYLNSR